MELRVREHGPHVVVVTIDNQPRRNAMTRAMMAELGQLWETLERGPCRCIVLTGAGDRAFSSGADVGGDLSADPDIARLIVLGIGMRTHTGVARRMFGALAERGINITMINTSEVRITVVVDRPHGEEALAALRQTFLIS